MKAWPTSFLSKKAGNGCPECESGRVDETEHGVRFFVGDVADGYLQKAGPTAGYSVVIFRGRHVGAPHEMTAQEHAAFWTEVGAVATAIELVYRPIHLNFQILGNQDPHVHVHIVARFDPDPAPSLPLPADAWRQSRRLADTEMAEQIARLRGHVSRGSGIETVATISVRRASEDDVEGCVRVLSRLPDYFTPDTHDELRAAMASHVAWVATDDTASEDVVGFVLAEQRFARSAEITFAAVQPERRGAGIGTLLVDRLLEDLTQHGVGMVEVKTLDASANHEPYVATRAFWEARGFIQVDCIDPLPGWQAGNPSAIYIAALDHTH